MCLAAHPLFLQKKQKNTKHNEKKATFARFIYSEFQQIINYSILHL